jgi:hypothetical protein
LIGSSLFRIEISLRRELLSLPASWLLSLVYRSAKFCLRFLNAAF